MVFYMLVLLTFVFMRRYSEMSRGALSGTLACLEAGLGDPAHTKICLSILRDGRMIYRVTPNTLHPEEGYRDLSVEAGYSEALPRGSCSCICDLRSGYCVQAVFGE